MRNSYVSVLTTDDYLDGLLVLAYSLRASGSEFGFMVLVTPNISTLTRAILADHSIPLAEVDHIHNPTDVSAGHRWFRTYSKLHAFGLVEYDKIVYLDADMLILDNIDSLFTRAHMSAASSGSLLPECSHWTSINTGLFVAVPSSELFRDMLAQRGLVEPLQSGGTLERPKRGSDQDFIGSYYSDWAMQSELHLDHKYNMLHYHLDRYNEHLGYTLGPGPRRVAVVHYASRVKPWHPNRDSIHTLQSGSGLTHEEHALRLWLDTRTRMLASLAGRHVGRHGRT